MSGKTIKILLVDDHTMFRQGLLYLLHGQPHLTVVGEAADGQAALELARAHKPDLVIMDLHLAGENGIGASRRILAEFPAIKIIVLSGDSGLTRVTEALQVGVSGYVTKENASAELMRAIQAVMDHRSYLCPEVASVVVGDYLKSLEGKPIQAAKPSLTERELRLLKLVAEGKRNKEIAAALDVAVKSVETYRSRLMKKLGCASANELTRYAIREGIASL